MKLKTLQHSPPISLYKFHFAENVLPNEKSSVWIMYTIFFLSPYPERGPQGYKGVVPPASLLPVTLLQGLPHGKASSCPGSGHRGCRETQDYRKQRSCWPQTGSFNSCFFHTRPCIPGNCQALSQLQNDRKPNRWLDPAFMELKVWHQY